MQRSRVDSPYAGDQPLLRHRDPNVLQRSRSPHFHASYAGAEAQVRITPLGVLNGALPPRALALVVEWASVHERRLLDNWRRLHSDQPPERIAPLE